MHCTLVYIILLPTGILAPEILITYKGVVVLEKVYQMAINYYYYIIYEYQLLYHVHAFRSWEWSSRQDLKSTFITIQLNTSNRTDTIEQKLSTLTTRYIDYILMKWAVLENTLPHKRRRNSFRCKGNLYNILYKADNTFYEQNRNVLSRNYWHLKTVYCVQNSKSAQKHVL